MRKSEIEGAIKGISNPLYLRKNQKYKHYCEVSGEYSEQAYSLMVKGDSMTNPYDKNTSFPDGCLVVVEPNEKVSLNDYVVAKKVGKGIILKQLISDKGKLYLKPLNPNYKLIEITDDVSIVGVVKEKLESKF